MKLQLNHLSGYLPYGLEMQTPKNYNFDGHRYFEDTVMKVEGLNQNYVKFEGLPGYHPIDNFKPILRPLSDLTKEIEHEGERIVPISELLKLYYHKWFNDKKGSRYEIIECDTEGYPRAWVKFQATLSIQINPSNITKEEYWVVQKLLSYHFDIHSLIPAGLAVDINTLNK